MSIYSSREPFNDDPQPYECSQCGDRDWQANDEYYEFAPRPEYNRPQNNPTNPILVEFRRLVKETGNGLYVTAFLFYGDLLEEWESHPLEQWHHAMDVLEKILSMYKEES